MMDRGFWTMSDYLPADFSQTHLLLLIVAVLLLILLLFVHRRRRGGNRSLSALFSSALTGWWCRTPMKAKYRSIICC
jgi:hypothetical protein